ncbi:MAG: DNA polymerase III subunit gamma/tau [Bacillota bacterium]
MAYLALYRQYRPKSFSEVVGQQHIVKTLSNAILTGKIGHAYLFCGPRGTGKTSIARVLAKSLNCVHGPTVTPCGVCPSCTAIDQGSSVDVREIDAASNGLVEDVRSLRETIHYAAESRYKVYIIDEVHSMKDMAFNALLKTLEEPPANVIFVLATTEAHKVPMTILSRCQRFDFRRIASAEIVAHLKSIAAQGEAKITEEAVSLVADRAQGGMRDALSLLDQCLAYGGTEVTRSDVLAVLGSVADQTLANLLKAVLDGSPLRMIELLDQVEAEGKDLSQLIKDLIQYLRSVLTGEGTAEMEIKQEQLVGFLNILAACESEMRWSSQPRLNLELALFKMSEDYRYGDRVKSLEARLEKLENGQALLASPESRATIPKERGQELPFAPDETAQERPAKAPPPQSPVVTSPPDRSKEDGVFAAAPEPVQDDQLQAVQAKWNDIMEWVKKEKISAHAILLHARLRSLAGDLLELNFNEEFHRRTIERTDNKQVVERGLAAILSQPYRIRCTKGQETIAAPPKTTATNGAEAKSAAADEDLLIAGAIQLFGKDKVEIKN